MSEPDEAAPFANMSLGQLFAAHTQARDPHPMHDAEFMAAVFALIENLSSADLFTVRRLLSLERANAPMSFVDGIVVAHLRWQRRIDPDTGRDLDEQTADALAQAFRSNPPPPP